MKSPRYFALPSRGPILTSSRISTQSLTTDGTSQEDQSIGMTETTTSYSSSPNLSDTEVLRLQKMLRRALRLKLKIPPGKVYYVEGWGWL
jgi:hypothetical protein